MIIKVSAIYSEYVIGCSTVLSKSNLANKQLLALQPTFVFCELSISSTSWFFAWWIADYNGYKIKIISHNLKLQDTALKSKNYRVAHTNNPIILKYL